MYLGLESWLSILSMLHTLTLAHIQSPQLKKHQTVEKYFWVPLRCETHNYVTRVVSRVGFCVMLCVLKVTAVVKWQCLCCILILVATQYYHNYNNKLYYDITCLVG